MTSLHSMDRAIVGAILIVLIVSIGVHLYDTTYFQAVYAFEDGPVEYATAFGLLFCCFAFIAHTVSLRRRHLHWHLRADLLLRHGRGGVLGPTHFRLAIG